MPKQQSQRGFSLVELMVAITLSSIIMGAAIQFMLTTKDTYDINDDISRIQENGRIALDIMVKDLQMAGYRGSLGQKPNFVLTQCGTDSNGNTRPCATDGAGTASDRLAIQYDPPPDDGTTPDMDCLGTQVAAPATDVIVNVYTIRDPGTGINSLFCQGYNATQEAWISPAPQPLVDGIDNMQVLYRVQNDDGTAQYIDYDQVAATNSFANINAIRVALLVSNGLATGNADSKTRQYQVLDSPVITFANDRQPRRIYSTTVQLNNRF